MPNLEMRCSSASCLGLFILSACPFISLFEPQESIIIVHGEAGFKETKIRIRSGNAYLNDSKFL